METPTFELADKAGYNDIWKILVGVADSYLNHLDEILGDPPRWHLYLFLACYNGVLIGELKALEFDLKKATKFFKYGREDFWDNLLSKGASCQVLSGEQFYHLDQYIRSVALGYHQDNPPQNARACSRTYRRLEKIALERQPELAKILEGHYHRNPELAPPPLEELTSSVDHLTTPDEFWKTVKEWESKGESPTRIQWKIGFWFVTQSFNATLEKHNGNFEKAKESVLNYFKPNNIRKVMDKIRNKEIKRAPYRKEKETAEKMASAVKTWVLAGDKSSIKP